MNLMIQPMKMKMRKTRMILVKLRTKTLMRMKLNKKAMKQKKTTMMKMKSLKVIKKWLVIVMMSGATALFYKLAGLASSYLGVEF